MLQYWRVVVLATGTVHQNVAINERRNILKDISEIALPWLQYIDIRGNNIDSTIFLEGVVKTPALFFIL